MKRSSTRFRFAMLLLGLLAGATAAQDYPNRAIRLIVTFPPGGGADIVARVLAPHLIEQLGQQVVIDNRSGGSGIIGLELAAKAPPDGYTLVVGISGTLAINPSMFPKLPYDPIRDFAPISLVAVGPNVLVVHPSLPVRSVPELIAFAKQRPGKLSYASSGTGGAPHLAGELFKYMAGVDIVHIPYKGAAPATTDVLGGHVPMMFAGMGAAIPYIETGKLRPMGVAGPKRSSRLPAVPAIAEFLPGFSAETWFGVLAPRGTPPAIVGRLSAAIKTAASRRDVKDHLLAGGYEVQLSTPAEFADYIALEVKKWAKVIKAAGIKAE
ncbi:MAG: Bug family tripartite tricarboxylate transporter substrate binding protein [Burkholderiales bacterium]